MSTVEKLRNGDCVPLKRYVRVCGHAVLAIALALFFSSPSDAQVESETVEFDIPASTLPQALTVFARQSRVELVFAERGFDDVQTQAVVGLFRKKHALELLLAGTGLQVGYGSGDSMIVQRADTPETTGDAHLNGDDPSMVLLAQVATDESQRAVNDTRTYSDSDGESLPRTNRHSDVERSQALEEITVTGSRIRGAESASPIVTIDRAEIEMAGFATVEDVIENLPQNFGAGASLDSFNSDANRINVVGGNIDNRAGGTSVNLRGLGANSTLVLLNGRRLSPSGFAADFTNIASIPVTAIERVEVMTDGASAIYGSDAIGGVINFVLRNDFEGAETRLRYGSDPEGDTYDTQFGQSFGTSWNNGNFIFSYEYFEREALASTDRAFIASSDLRPLGGSDWRQPGGTPANIRVGPFGARVFYAIPEGQDGTALTPEDFVGRENTQNFFNDRVAIDVLPDVERHSGFLHAAQRVGVFDLFGAARFSQEENARRTALNRLLDFPSVTSASPFFVDPTDTGLTTVRVDNYSLFEELGPQVNLAEIDTYGATLGASVEFAENWSGELALNWSKEEALRSPTNFIAFEDRAPLRATANLTDPALAFNPFGDGSSANNRAILEQFVTRSAVPDITSENELRSASLDVNGDVVKLAGGMSKLAVGIDFREESLFTQNFRSGELIQSADLSRDVLAAYVELFLPLVGDDNSRPGLQRLEMSFAARHEDFSDFGNSTNPKFGILWSPTKSLTLRGTFGTSYRAPSLTSLDDSTLSPIFFVPESFFGEPLILAQGRNPSLQEEEATTWTAGFQWDPENLQGFSLDATYFSVDFSGRIERPTISVIEALTDPRFETIRVLDPTREQIESFINSPNYEPDRFAPSSAEDVISGAVPVNALVDIRLTNLADSVVNGAELQLSYTADTEVGSFSFGLNGNYIIDFERRLVSVDPLVDEVDTFGRPVDLRARGNASWNRKNWLIAAFVNYTDGYTDNLSSLARVDDPQEVQSWTTVDLTVAYEIDNIASFLNDTRLSLTIQNLFDEEPPFVDTAGGAGYDAVNANPIGRYFALQIRTDW